MPGRVVGEATEGHCCWPGQRWDAALNRCDGVPACPAGYGGAGAECERPPPPAQILAPPEPPPPPPAPAPSIEWARSAEIPMREVQQPLPGLWITGTVLAALAHAYCVVMGSIFLTSSSDEARHSWTMYIPVVGGFVWAAVHDEGAYWGSVLGEMVGIPGAGVQVLGLGLLAIGLLARRTVRVPDYRPRATAGPGDLGLGPAWDF